MVIHLRWLALLVGGLVLVLGVQRAQSTPTDLFFSEYVEGTSNNKALELYNGTGTAINLEDGVYNVQMYFNGSATAGLTINLSGTVANGDVFVLAQSAANATILAQADQTNGSGWFNGDDAVVLRKGTTILDVIGQIGFDPGTEWGTGLTSTADNTLRRKSSIEAGDTNGSDAFDPSVQWDGFATDTFDNLGEGAPFVVSTNPSKNAENVPQDANVQITFNEPVNVSGNWFGILCGSTELHSPGNTAVTASPDAKTYTLDPNTNFGANLSCIVTIFKDNVTDQDSQDPPNSMVQDYTFDFRTGAADAAPSVASTSPTDGATNVAVDANVTVDFSEPVAPTSGWYAITCVSSGSHTATESGGPQTFTLNPDSDFANNETCTVTIDATKVTDVDASDPPDQMASNYTFSFRTTLALTQIAQIQGAQHLSPFSGQPVKTEGVVIAERGSNVWLQDPTPDDDPATSEGILVFGSSVASAVAVGDLVQMTGTVSEFRPGCSPSCAPSDSAFDNLTVTELASPGLAVTKLGTATLPPATVIGSGGRVPPTEVIENDATTGNVETSNTFDPAEDGIDFDETLESMLVQVNSPVVVGPRNGFGEILVLADDGAAAGVRTARGGIVIRPSDFNPERFMLDDLILPTPAVDVADHFTTAAKGVMTYDFANYKIAITDPLTAVDGGLEPEVTDLPRENELAVATFNVENLAPSDPASKFERLAGLIVDHLRAPDIVAIEEIQDNDGVSGGTASPVVDASVTWQMLISAIAAAGGPEYHYRQIDPQDDQDGGAPGGNIRVGFLFRTDRGLAFVDRPGGNATTPTSVFRQDGRAHLTLSPGRIDPANPAWDATRKPLAGEFIWFDKTVIVIANHFSSKGGDDPLFGRFQPPVQSTAPKRHEQAASVNGFARQIVAAEQKANFVVLGDINDFEFSQTTEILESGGVMFSLMHRLSQAERYSYVFEGNSQVLDQILFSANMLRGLSAYDVVHVNSEFADQASDHDPSVARVKVPGAGGGSG